MYYLRLIYLFRVIKLQTGDEQIGMYILLDRIWSVLIGRIWSRMKLVYIPALMVYLSQVTVPSVVSAKKQNTAAERSAWDVCVFSQLIIIHVFIGRLVLLIIFQICIAIVASFQVTDFRSKVTITVYTVPGEEELGQPLYQVEQVFYSHLMRTIHLLEGMNFIVKELFFFFQISLLCSNGQNENKNLGKHN